MACSPCAEQLFSFTLEPFAPVSNAATQHRRPHNALREEDRCWSSTTSTSRAPQRILWLLEELGLPYEIRFYERDRPDPPGACRPCWPCIRWASRRC